MKNQKKLISITTKKGDTGLSSLANGERINKSNIIFEVLGNLDELNSWLGLIIAEIDSKYAVDKQILLESQQKIFVISGYFAKAQNCLVDDQWLKKLENRAAVLQKKMINQWHNYFIYPGGSRVSATIDIARTICRKSERRVVAYLKRPSQETDLIIIASLNRLSDYLYLLRCYLNFDNQYQEKRLSLSKE